MAARKKPRRTGKPPPRIGTLAHRPFTTGQTLLTITPIATYFEETAPFTLNYLPDQADTADKITNHALRRFRQRIRRLPRKTVHRILHTMHQTCNIADGKSIFNYQGLGVELVIRNGYVVTVIDNHHWER